jgi:hypothetical protein
MALLRGCDREQNVDESYESIVRRTFAGRNFFDLIFSSPVSSTAITFNGRFIVVRGSDPLRILPCTA